MKGFTCRLQQHRLRMNKILCGSSILAPSHLYTLFLSCMSPKTLSMAHYCPLLMYLPSCYSLMFSSYVIRATTENYLPPCLLCISHISTYVPILVTVSSSCPPFPSIPPYVPSIPPLLSSPYPYTICNGF